MMRTIVTLAFIAVLLWIHPGMAAMDEFPVVGARPPVFTLPDLAGNEITFSVRLDKPLVINFWTTWCGVCVHELPLLQEFYERYGDQVGLLTVCSGTTPKEAEELVQADGLTFPVLYDDGRVVAGAYQPPRPRDERRIIAFPFTVFIDASGTVVYAKIGAFLTVEKLIAKLRAAGITITAPQAPGPPPPDIGRRGVRSES